MIYSVVAESTVCLVLTRSLYPYLSIGFVKIYLNLVVFPISRQISHIPDIGLIALDALYTDKAKWKHSARLQAELGAKQGKGRGTHQGHMGAETHPYR